ASIPTPQIPAIPGAPASFAGLDPKVSLPRGVAAPRGGALRVPVRVENTDRVPVGIEAFDLAIQLDPAVFDVRAVKPSGLASEYDPTWSFDRQTGLLMITAGRLAGPETLLPGDAGSVATIELAVRPGARLGATALNLLGSTYAEGALRS